MTFDLLNDDVPFRLTSDTDSVTSARVWLEVAGTIDREERQFYSITVTVTDGSYVSHTLYSFSFVCANVFKQFSCIIKYDQGFLCDEFTTGVVVC